MEQVSKITISIPALTALEKMVDAVNQGFEGGRVSRHELASWILVRFATREFARSIEPIRKAHFDELSYLEKVLKRAKAERRKGAPAKGIGEILSLHGYPTRKGRSKEMSPNTAKGPSAPDGKESPNERT